jgi:hypothetical protein
VNWVKPLGCGCKPPIEVSQDYHPPDIVAVIRFAILDGDKTPRSPQKLSSKSDFVSKKIVYNTI